MDNFRRLNKIDEGAYGVVYRVQHKKTGETLALKKVKIRGDTRSEGFPVTALREVDLLLSVHHRNIVNVYETVVGRTRDEVCRCRAPLAFQGSSALLFQKKCFKQ